MAWIGLGVLGTMAMIGVDIATYISGVAELGPGRKGYRPFDTDGVPLPVRASVDERVRTKQDVPVVASDPPPVAPSTRAEMRRNVWSRVKTEPYRTVALTMREPEGLKEFWRMQAGEHDKVAAPGPTERKEATHNEDAGPPLDTIGIPMPAKEHSKYPLALITAAAAVSAYYLLNSKSRLYTE